jgi:hypothetical protein
MATPKEIELDAAKMRRREDGVLHVVLADDLDLTLETCRAMNAAVQQLAQGPSLILSDLRGMRSSGILQMRYAVAPEVIGVIRRLALVVGSPVSRTLGNVFVALAKPPYPTRLFTDEDAAVAWLLEGAEEGR